MGSVERKFTADNLIDLIGFLLTLFTLSIIIIGPMFGYTRSLAVFMMVSLILTFYLYKGGTSPFWSKFNFIDAIWMILSVVVMGYLVVNNAHIISRIEYVTEITQIEYILGILAIIITLEATRRAIGLPMVLICLVLLSYLWFGKYLSGYFGHVGFTMDWIIDTMYLTTRGIFGSPLWVVVTLAYTFILYGMILEEMGVLQTFLDFANKIFGKADGASAKTAIASGVLMGMASGLPMSTTYLIGFPTIPKMIEGGYPRVTAGATAAVAGTAAQLMPPMLGVAAFVLAQYMGIPYIKVCQYTLLPALMFYFVFFWTVHFEAKKFGVKGMGVIDKTMGQIFAEGFYIFVISILVLLFFLFQFTPVGLAAAYACAVALILGVFKKKDRLDFAKFYKILARTGRLSAYIAMACAAAGIITGLLIETGLNLKFATLILSLGSANVWSALILSAIAILILSMGMPSIPAYITGIAVFGSALMELDFVPATVHIFVFYYATLYAITPPVAFAAYAGAQISGTDPVACGFEGMRLGMLTYLIPMIFIFDPAFLLIPEYWTIQKVIMFIVFVVPGLVLFAAGMAGYWKDKLPFVDRWLAIFGGLMMIAPFMIPRYIGFVIFVYSIFKQGVISDFLKRSSKTETEQKM
ncbi:MAG: TRAP transporter fused permease subunit [Syntrophomonadaceae bacterium]|nr:TRAP transporter fused permease subunit [Syntrophomonadaceae bacterium]